MSNTGKILLICDNKSSSSRLKEQLLGWGNYTVIEESSGQAGIVSLSRGICDLVIINCTLPETDTALLVRELKNTDPDCVAVVLLETGQTDKADELAESGVFETVSREAGAEKLRFIVDSGIKLHGLLSASRRLNLGLVENNLALEKQNTLLAGRIEDATTNLSRLYEDLRSTYMRTIKVLAQTIDARDHYTHSHSENVVHYAVAIAKEMKLPARDIELIRQACELHDLGKIGIGDSILLKTSSLTPLEWEQIRKHPAIGAQILEPLTFLNAVVGLVRQHHEHYDGSGYPEGRKEDDILLGARIIHVADAYEAMRSARSYRKIPLMKDAAVLEVKRNSGTQFDPRIVDVFLRVVDNL